MRPPRVVGKRVGFAQLPRGQGAYSEYVTANAMTSCFSLPEDVPVEDACSHFVNPYTAFGILETAKERGARVSTLTMWESTQGMKCTKWKGKRGAAEGSPR